MKRTFGLLEKGEKRTDGCAINDYLTCHSTPLLLFSTYIFQIILVRHEITYITYVIVKHRYVIK